MTPPSKRSRLVNNAARVGQLASLMGLMLLGLATSASADIGDKGSPDPLTVVEKLGYFIGIPVLVYLICVAIFMRPGSGGAARYRPHRGWDSDPATFGTAPTEVPEVTASESSPEPGLDVGGGSRGSW